MKAWEINQLIDSRLDREPQPRGKLDIIGSSTAERYPTLQRAAIRYNREDRKYVYWVVRSPWDGYILVRDTTRDARVEDVMRAKTWVREKMEAFR